MTAQGESSSQHLTAARELLDGLKPLTQTPEAHPEATAMAAAAHSILVLAEQVAVVRVLLAGDAVARRNQAQPDPTPTGPRTAPE